MRPSGGIEVITPGALCLPYKRGNVFLD